MGGGAFEEGWEKLLDRFVKWAQSQPDINAAAVLGSRARTERGADEWSDLDIVILTANPDRYLASSDWLGNIGNPWITFLEKTATGDQMERRVLFEGGLDVDFAIIPRNVLQKVPVEFYDIARRGVRVLVDKEGALADALRNLPSEETSRVKQPTQFEFLELVNDFWYHAVWTAKKLGRANCGQPNPAVTRT